MPFTATINQTAYTFHAEEIYIEIASRSLPSINLIHTTSVPSMESGICNGKVWKLSNTDCTLDLDLLTTSVTYGADKSGFTICATIVSDALQTWLLRSDNQYDLRIHQKYPGDQAELFMPGFFPGKKVSYTGHLNMGLIQDYSCVVVRKQKARIQEISDALNQQFTIRARIHTWFLTNHQDTPITLVIDEPDTPNMALGVKTKWERLNDVYLSALGDSEKALNLRRPYTLKNPGAFFKGITSFGPSQDIQGYVENYSEFIHGPCTIRYQNQIYVVTSVKFEWKPDNPETVSVILSMSALNSRVYRKPESAILLTGVFEKWQKNTDGTNLICVKPFKDNLSWCIINQNGDPDPNCPLVCQSVMPGVSDKVLKGIYIKHEKGDVMQILIAENSIPVVLGGLQTYKGDYETVDIRIQGKGALLTSDAGLTLNAQEILAMNSEKQIAMNEQLTLTSNQVTIKDKLIVENKAEITELEAGSMG